MFVEAMLVEQVLQLRCARLAHAIGLSAPATRFGDHFPLKFSRACMGRSPVAPRTILQIQHGTGVFTRRALSYRSFEHNGKRIFYHRILRFI